MKLSFLVIQPLSPVYLCLCEADFSPLLQSLLRRSEYLPPSCPGPLPFETLWYCGINQSIMMGKSSKNTKSSALPLTPILYINDPVPDTPNVEAIAALIPSTKILSRNSDDSWTWNRKDMSRDYVQIVADDLSEGAYNERLANGFSWFKKIASKHGCNFVSINLYLHSSTSPDKLSEPGTNHLDLNISQLSPEETAEKVYKWLCTPPSPTTHITPTKLTLSHRPLRRRNPTPHPRRRDARHQHQTLPTLLVLSPLRIPTPSQRRQDPIRRTHHE